MSCVHVNAALLESTSIRPLSPRNLLAPTSYNCMVFASGFWGEGQGERGICASTDPSRLTLSPPVLCCKLRGKDRRERPGRGDRTQERRRVSIDPNNSTVNRRHSGFVSYSCSLVGNRRGKAFDTVPLDFDGADLFGDADARASGRLARFADLVVDNADVVGLAADVDGDAVASPLSRMILSSIRLRLAQKSRPAIRHEKECRSCRCW